MKRGDLVRIVDNLLTVEDGLNGLYGIILKVHRRKYNRKLLNILLGDNRIIKLYDNEINLISEL